MLLAVLLLPCTVALAQNSAEAAPEKAEADTDSPDEAAADEAGEDSATNDNVAEADPTRPSPREQARRQAKADEGASNDAEAEVPIRLRRDEGAEPSLSSAPPPEPVGPKAPRPRRVHDWRQVPPIFFESQFEPENPMQLDDDPNAAVARPGPGSPNAADTGLRVPGQAANGEAVPPEPEVNLPPPGEIAGEVGDYVPPSVELQIPGLEPLPPPPADDEFIIPERAYILERPFPPPAEGESEEERTARSIEEAIRTIDLALEQRTGQPITVPLPAGDLTFSADDGIQINPEDGKSILQGNAEILFQDIAIWADRIEINEIAGMAYARGYVAVQRQSDILYADEAYLNFDTQVLELFNVEGNTGGPKIEGHLYFFARRAYGTFDRMLLDNVELTTCDPFCGSPREVHLSARRAVYKANRSLVLHDVYANVRESRVAYIPIFAVPLKRDINLFETEESEIQQTYGRNFSEGWFAKFAYTYYQRFVDPAKVRDGGPLVGVAKLDLTQKQGPGFGVRQDLYNPSLGVTTLRGYYQQQWDWDRVELPDGTLAPARSNTELTLSQELHLSKALNGKLDIERKDTFVPRTSLAGRDQRSNTWNNRFNLNYKKGDTTSQLTASQNISITGGQAANQPGQQLETISTNTNASLSFDQKITDELDLRSSYAYTAEKGRQQVSGVPADQEGTLRAELSYTPDTESALAGYNAKVRWQEQHDIDGERNQSTQDSNRNIREELPSIEINLPRDLIAEGAYFNQFTINLDNLVTGTRRRPETSFRGKFRTAGSDSTQFSRSARGSTNLIFEQYLYDDGNAQYVIAPRADWSYDSFNGWRFDARYNLHFQQGVRFPPVSSDRQTYRQDINFGLNMTNYRDWRWTLGTGFNLAREEVQLRDENGNLTGEIGIRKISPRPLSSSFTWDPSRSFGLNHSVSYRLLDKEWSQSRIGMRFVSPYTHPDGIYNWYVGVASDVNTDYASYARATSFDIDWFKRYERGWSSQIVGQYRTSNAGIDDPGEFAKDFIKRIAVRKVNCCTTLEAGWRVGVNQVYIMGFVNALPQYPATAEFYRPFDDEMVFDVLFPTDQMFNDIQRELFGTSQSLQGLGGLL